MPLDQTLKVVNIVATSYSGSTWLNMMLGAHPGGFTIGEMDWIDKTGKAVCSLHGADCPIWRQFDPNASENPYRAIARIAGADTLIVNNTRRYLDPQQAPGIAPRYIWLIRDGRAVVASTMRKYKDLGICRSTRRWVKAMKKKRRFIQAQDASRVLTVHYEKLSQDTEGELRRICEFLGWSFDPIMLHYSEVEQHPIGGNPGAISVVADQQKLTRLHNPLVNAVELDAEKNTVLKSARGAHVDLGFYRKAENQKDGRLVDERWKQEMSTWHLRLFSLLAGRLNRRLGYGSSTNRD